MKYFATFFIIAFCARISSAQLIFTADEFIQGLSQVNTNQTEYRDTTLPGLGKLAKAVGAGISWDFTGIPFFPVTTNSNVTVTVLTYPGGAALANDILISHLQRTL